MSRPRYPLRYMKVRDGQSCGIEQFPNFGPNGNLTGMRQQRGWQNAMPVKCGAYIYNVDASTYHKAKDK